jgi:hypothetical protein
MFLKVMKSKLYQYKFDFKQVLYAVMLDVFRTGQMKSSCQVWFARIVHNYRGCSQGNAIIVHISLYSVVVINQSKEDNNSQH